MQSNRSAAERAADALIEAAEAKNHAAVLRKKAERILDATFLQQSGSVEERKAKARQDLQYIRADDAALEAEHQANIAKARADAASLVFEAWRSEEATRRQDGRFIAGMR